MKVFGLTTTLLVLTSSFVISALLIMSIRPKQSAHVKQQVNTTWLPGRLHYVARYPDIAAVLIVKLVGNIL